MSTISTTEQPQMQQIDLMKLNLQQLTQLKNQLDQELTIFQDSLQTLKMAKGKFGASKDALEQFKEGDSKKTTLIPLTGSMYVPGRIKDIDNVIIDIGTGYYVEKDRDSAKDYFKRKVDFVSEQIDKIEVLGFEKSQIRDAICEVMTIKIQQLKGSIPAQES
ncbi:hypothetical protein PVAND_001913 [Polypedilum vanderplanki]|uniref:Prefoldin subunit 5 n=1 Tax=Polypedilum vanderplanki TaxID=319348 RepID=A0A9J6BPW3_POLVA|nr:hypothetical protein PVAND_001913 [Polypedilum vanderplanki]